MYISFIYSYPNQSPIHITQDHIFNWKLTGINCASDDYSLGTVASVLLVFETDVDDIYVNREPVETPIYNYGYLMSEGFNGTFAITNVERKKNTKNHYTVTATSEFEVGWDEILTDAQIQPVQNETLAALCTRLSIPHNSVQSVNSSYVTNPNWSYSGVTRRQVAQWVYQLEGLNYGGECRPDWWDEPALVPNWFEPSTTNSYISLTPNDVKSIDKCDYTTQQIDRIWFGSDGSDVGLSYGSGRQQLSIPINPLINYEDTSFLQPLYNKVHSLVPYTPMKIETFLSSTLLSKLVNSQQKYYWMKYTEDNTDYYCPIFNWEASPSGIVMEGTGSADRTTTNTYLGGEIANAGKYNKFQRTLDYTISEVGNLSGEYSNLTQTVNGLTSTVVNKDGVISAINQSAETITINANRIEFNGVVTFSDLDSSTQQLINSKTDSQDVTQIIGGTVNANYINALDINAGKVTATYTKTFNHSDYSSSDYITIQMLARDKNWTAAELDRYDINMDGQITNADLIKVRNMVQNGTDETATIKTEIDPSKVGNPIAIYANGATTPGASMNGSSVRGGAGIFNNIQADTVNAPYVYVTESGNSENYIYLYGNQIDFRKRNGNGDYLLGSISPASIVIDSGTTSTTTNYTSGSQSFSCWVDWDYRKWGDGTYECWGKATLYVAAGQWDNWGGVRSSQTFTPHLNYPVTFLSAPHEHVTACPSNDDWGFWISAGATANCNNTTTTTAKYQLIRGADGSINSYSNAVFRIEYYVIGKVSV